MVRRLLANWELKILSVVIAFALWLLVVGSGKSQFAVAAVVEYTGLDSELVLVGRPRDTAEVELEAARWAIARLTPGAVRVRVNLAGTREGENVVALSSDLVEAPAGVTVRRVTPARLHVMLAGAIAKTLQVVPRVRGVPEPGHAIVRVTVDPATVQVKGPRSTIEGRTAVEAVPVDTAGRRETVTQSVGLVLPESVYLTGQSRVLVTVEIKPEEPMTQGGRGREGTGR
jgi:YbbR domain-containing protein